VGWPVGVGRKGRKCTSTQYWAYVCDWLDVHNNYGTAAAHYRVLWKSLSNNQRVEWINSKTTSAYSPIVAHRLDEAAVRGAYNRITELQTPPTTTVDKQVLATAERLLKLSITKPAVGLFKTGVFAGMQDMKLNLSGQFTRKRFWATMMSIEMPTTTPQMVSMTKPPVLAMLPKIFEKDSSETDKTVIDVSRTYGSISSTSKINPALATGLGVAGMVLVAGIVKKQRDN